MKYFIDTEFKEGPQDKTFMGFKYGETKPTIDLISIGIVSENGREYYAISKDFNLKQAWQDEWLCDNVLLPIYKDHVHGDMRNHNPFSYLTMKGVINGFGKSNKQIAQEIQHFIRETSLSEHVGRKIHSERSPLKLEDLQLDEGMVEFWAYYADYDWVVFCQLFGRMIDLPKGFPMYCRDLKQLMDDIDSKQLSRILQGKEDGSPLDEKDRWYVKNHPNYPKNPNKHHALWDAKEDRDLYQFLINL